MKLNIEIYVSCVVVTIPFYKLYSQGTVATTHKTTHK